MVGEGVPASTGLDHRRGCGGATGSGGEEQEEENGMAIDDGQVRDMCLCVCVGGNR